MNGTDQHYLDLAAEIARDAAGLLGSRAPAARCVRTEQGRDIKIEGDFLLDEFILGRLRATGLSIVSEESGGSLSDEACWIIDPLDGSFNFARGLPFCAVSIGLWRHRRPVAGVIHDLVRGEQFTGLLGAGAWIDGEPIQPSRITERSQAVLCTGVPIRNEFGTEAATEFAGRVRAFKKTRLLGSAALMLAYVACGRADAYREERIALWDVAAGLAIVQAAGGRGVWRQVAGQDLLDVEATNGLLTAGDQEGFVTA